MPFNKYYQDELTFLRELGAEFAHKHQIADHLVSDHQADPDVERLMEGFAFLAGQLRQKLDDELPELTHSLIGLMWPHYLRPIPSMTIIQFSPRPSLRAVQPLARNIEILSRPIEGTVCRFRTCYEVDLAPLQIIDLTFETALAAPSTLKLKLQLINQLTLDKLELPRLRLHLHGDPGITFELYLRLLTQVQEISVQGLVGGRPGKPFRLAPSAIQPVGFDRADALLPYPEHSFSGYRLIQEYFALPQKFLFLDLTGLEPLAQCASDDGTFEIVFHFKGRSPEIKGLSPGHIRLHCTPAVNLFSHDSDPLEIDHKRTEYRVRPTCEHVEHYEIFSVDDVVGIQRNIGKQVHYPHFFAFNHHQSGAAKAGLGTYQTRIKAAGRPREEDEEVEVYRIETQRESTIGHGSDTYITFSASDGNGAIPAAETISIMLTCTNRHLAEKLDVNDLSVDSESTPASATFQNILKPTPSVMPPLNAGLHWRLVSQLSLNYLSVINVEALRGILELYNFQAFYDQAAARANEQRLTGLLSIESKSDVWIHRGAPIRGRAIHLVMQEDNFAGEGDMYLLAAILNEFFALYATMNSFTQLNVRGKRRGEQYRWERQLGQQIVI